MSSAPSPLTRLHPIPFLAASQTPLCFHSLSSLDHLWRNSGAPMINSGTHGGLLIGSPPRAGFQLLGPSARHSRSTGGQQLNSPGVSRRRPLRTRLCPRTPMPRHRNHSAQSRIPFTQTHSSVQDAFTQSSWTVLSRRRIRSKKCSRTPDPPLDTDDSYAGLLSRPSPVNADRWGAPPSFVLLTLYGSSWPPAFSCSGSAA